MLDAFLERFVLPLLSGGFVHVQRPMRPVDLDGMAGYVFAPSTPLSFVRLRRAEVLIPDPVLPDPGIDELSLWVGLHNILAFDHPERPRVWTRSSTWRRVEGATRTMLTLPPVMDIGEVLARHLSIEAFIELRRIDTVVNTPTGDVRYLGQSLPRNPFRLGPVSLSPGREETVPWINQTHAPESQRLIDDAMRASPLTCLLHPLRAPKGWSPLATSPFLMQRGFARAVCYRWAAHRDWISVGGAVLAALLLSIPGAQKPDVAVVSSSEDGRPRALPGAVLPAGPSEVGAIVGALVHLHFLKVLEFEARLGLALGSRDPAVIKFLALPLLLTAVGDTIGSPLGGLSIPSRGSGNRTESFELQAHRRWSEHIDHLRELLPRSAVENLLARLVPAIVPTS